jgi:hypothetical protein
MQGLCSSQNICYGSLNVSMDIIEIILNCTPIVIINPIYIYLSEFINGY